MSDGIISRVVVQIDVVDYQNHDMKLLGVCGHVLYSSGRRVPIKSSAIHLTSQIATSTEAQELGITDQVQRRYTQASITLVNLFKAMTKIVCLKFRYGR